MTGHGKCFWLANTLLLLTGLTPGWGGDDSRRVLLRVSDNIIDTVERLPRYVCTETVSRARYAPDRTADDSGRKTSARSCDQILVRVNGAAWARRLAYSDRVRLDVAMSADMNGADSEMYSWVGEERFSDRSLFEMVPDGAMSTGTFAAMLAAIFGGDAARFSYDGDTIIEGNRLPEFGFRVPLEKSRYTYVFGARRRQQVKLAYDGTFLVDPRTADLVRLIIRAGDLPAESHACEIKRTIDYSRVSLDGAGFLLPKQARISIVHDDETVSENTIRYSACRAFRAESEVRYVAPGTAAVAAANNLAIQPFTLPAGLAFKVVFTDPIDTATAAAGDAIQGRLTTAITDRSGRVLAPAGSPVGGRIMAVRLFSTPSASAKVSGQQAPLTIAVRLEWFEAGGRRYALKAAFDAGTQRFLKNNGGLSVRVEIGPLDRLQDTDAGIFEFWNAQPDYVVEAGLVSKWYTAGPSESR